MYNVACNRLISDFSILQRHAKKCRKELLPICRKLASLQPLLYLCWVSFKFTNLYIKFVLNLAENTQLFGRKGNFNFNFMYILVEEMKC